MALYLVHSSGIVKRYAVEIGSAWITALVDPDAGNEIYIAGITAVEVVSALARRALAGSISATDAAAAIAHFKHELGSKCQVVEITKTLTERAMDLAEKHALRGYDAMQLAAAVELHLLAASSGTGPVTFVAADNALNSAAAAEGLAVDDPNTHP